MLLVSRWRPWFCFVGFRVGESGQGQRRRGVIVQSLRGFRRHWGGFFCFRFSGVCQRLDRGRGVFKCLLGLVQRFAQTFGGVLHGGLDRIGGFLHYIGREHVLT